MLAFLVKYVKISVMEAVREKKRIFLLDEIRGAAVFCMVLYHAYWIFGDVFGFSAAERLYDFFMPAEPLFAGVFIFVCGFSCLLSQSNLRRGLRIAAAAAVFTVITCVVLPFFGIKEFTVYFGILHFLGISVLLYAFTKKAVAAVEPWGGAFFCILFYLLTFGIKNGVFGDGVLIKIPLPERLFSGDWLMPLGIHSPSFFSADYFPLFPNIFLFFFGVFFGSIIMQKGIPEFAYKMRLRFFVWLGRHAFIIYAVHFPLTAAIAYIADKIFN